VKSLLAGETGEGVGELVSTGAVSGAVLGAVSVPASWAKAIAVGETRKLIETKTARSFRSATPFRYQRREPRRINLLYAASVHRAKVCLFAKAIRFLSENDPKKLTVASGHYRDNQSRPAEIARFHEPIV